MLRHEKKARKAGYQVIAGVDEAGRGTLAGPVVAATVILKDIYFTHKIDDSKKLTPRARLSAYAEILTKAVIGIGIACEKTIDKINIANATAKAMEDAVMDLGVIPDCVLVDGHVKLKAPCACKFIIDGDAKSLSIACASIIAKVTRDHIMINYHKRYPQYDFAKHKGYGTRSHIAAIKKRGPSPIHRLTFKPLKNGFIPGGRPSEAGKKTIS